MIVRASILVVGLVAVGGACSGGEDEPVSAPTTIAATTDAPATAAAPTATVPATTTTVAPATTTVAPATTPETTTTLAPATTAPGTTVTETTDDPFLEEAVQARFDVLDRVEAARAASRRMFEDPLNDDLVAALDDHYTGNLLEGFGNLVQQFRDGNFRSIPNEDHPEVYRADPVSLALDFEGGRATVQACHINTALIVESGGNPDGTDRVARDEIIEEIVELTVVRIDGVWKVSNAHTPETEIATCP